MNTDTDFDTYLKHVAEIYQCDFMAGDPAIDLTLEWVKTPEARKMIKKLYDKGVDSHDVYDILGEDVFYKYLYAHQDK